MNLRIQLLPALLIALLAHPAHASSQAPSGAAGPDPRASADGPKTPESSLKLAMAATDVLRIMGKPHTITPMKVETGKAEIWTYERRVGDRVEQVPVSTPTFTTVMGSDGKPHQIATGENVEYREDHHISTAVIDILMFNDHFVTVKTTLRESQQVVE